MGSIYSNAYLVISADGASCCTDGFLPEEEDYSWEIVYRQPFSEGNEDAEVVRLAREVDASEHQRKPYNSRSLDIEALSQRGWSMQECILPHRILHFTEEELIWECSTDCACECGNTRIHNLWKHHDYNLINDPRIQHVDERPYFNVHIDDFLRGKSAESTCWIWERLMEQYSQRFLTLPGDKIAAISGLARLFQKSLGASPTDYIAGLWKTDLPICLLWHVTGSSTPSRPVEWRAPSWSWASVDGGVGFFNERYQFSFRPHVRIEECVSEPVSVDPFGKVRKAKIRIAGDLVPVTLEVRAESKSAYKGQFVGHSGKPPKAFEDLNVTVRADGESYEILPDVRLESDTYDTCVEGYYCLRIGNTYDSMKDIYSSIKDLYDLRNNVELPRAGERCWWLVLQRAVGASEDGNGDLFRRFGIGMFDSSSRTVDIFPTRPLYQTHVTLI
jgi:hypothetical protein